ncbi:MAG: cryptochrome/photolyase family protein [Phycisphaerales bacterium JB050]
MAEPSELRARISGAVRDLVLILGDQLDANARVLSELDPELDAVLMMEIDSEVSGCGAKSRSPNQHATPILSAMRRFAQDLKSRGIRVRYITLDAPQNTHSFSGEIKRACTVLAPRKLRVTHPGESRILDELNAASKENSVPLDILEDEHVLTRKVRFASTRLVP